MKNDGLNTKQRKSNCRQEVQERMKQIAVVEDEPLMREELALMLRKAGYDPIEIREFDHVAE